MRSCVAKIRDEVMAGFCANGKHAANDRSCQQAHCITNCRISRECPGGKGTAVAASYWKEIVTDTIMGKTGYSSGDQCANADGRRVSDEVGKCETLCNLIQCKCGHRD